MFFLRVGIRTWSQVLGLKHNFCRMREEFGGRVWKDQNTLIHHEGDYGELQREGEILPFREREAVIDLRNYGPYQPTWNSWSNFYLVQLFPWIHWFSIDLLNFCVFFLAIPFLMLPLVCYHVQTSHKDS